MTTAVVPDQILDRRDKIGFTTPEDRWIRSLPHWVASVSASDVAKRIQGLNTAECAAEWNRVLNGDSAFDRQIWRWTNAILWAEVLDLKS